MDTNQPGPLEPYNLFTTDPLLPAAVAREGGDGHHDALANFGERVGSTEVFSWGDDANRYPPKLVSHDRFGDRIDEVEYHPAYHSLLELSVTEGLHTLRFETEPGDGGYVARNARMLMASQVDVGHGCPISMTGAVLPALRHQSEIAAEWEPRIMSRSYDPSLVAPGSKAGCLIGMGMTERQGGSDVRANTSPAVATNSGGPGGHYLITGHKWFTSAPMCDAFLILAQVP